MTKTWKIVFSNAPDVYVVRDDFKHFMDSGEAECVVSPANSYGLMDGGYDLAITEWFGEGLMKKVQTYILEHFRGEQPVATSFLIDTGKNDIKLIHTPTMRVPTKIIDPMVVYQCMRTTLLTVIEHNVQSVVIPAFGGGCGGLSPQMIAGMLREGYDQIMNPPEDISWQYADSRYPEKMIYQRLTETIN